MYNPVELIIRKRMGGELTEDEIRWFIGGYLSEEIPEYQMSALLMAIFFQSMKPEEARTLTRVYIESGKRISFPEDWHTVDKHSTGGVGDKITLPLAPLVAACGVKIPMISGRGLGHTGGTLDKLDSIAGMRTDFSEAEFKKMVEEVGFAIISQSKELVPADRRIYALRDVTGTVESLPLITASIMSKKIAEGAQNLVIDLKVGTGAFIKTIEQAEVLAELMISVGNQLGQKISVVFTDMNSPIGWYAGNALEIRETIEYLKGEPNEDVDLITKALAEQMLLLCGKAETREEARKQLDEVHQNGKALEKFRAFIQIQGGDPRICDDVDLLPQAKYEIPIIAEATGWIEAIDSQAIGYALVELGAGRRTLDSKLDYSTGAYLPKKIGCETDQGDPMGLVYANDEAAGIEVAKKIAAAYRISETQIEPNNRIIKIRD